jgi:hypothetical protein
MKCITSNIRALFYAHLIPVNKHHNKHKIIKIKIIFNNKLANQEKYPIIGICRHVRAGLWPEANGEYICHLGLA